MLTSGNRLALPRHQGLRAALEWSHGLLTPTQQTVFRRIRPGAGSFALEASQQVVADESVDEWASRSGRLGLHTRHADILIVAAGVPGLIRAEHVREGAVVLDVGINQVTDPATGASRLAGDVDYDAVAPRVRAITPVPGGIGPVTDVQVIRNTVAAARNATRPRAA